LGVPQPEPQPDRAALIIGWDQEERGGWSLSRVRIDDQVRDEWSPDTQEPAVLIVEPGSRNVRLFVERRASGLRLRMAPISLDLAEGEVHLCRLTASLSARPHADCTTLLRPPPAQARAPQSPTASMDDPIGAAEAAVAPGTPPDEPVIEGRVLDDPFLEEVDEPGGDIFSPSRLALLPNPFRSDGSNAPPSGVEDLGDDEVVPELVRSPYAPPAGADERLRRIEDRLERMERTLEEIREAMAR
jgi:hypothetical protein